MNYSKKIVCLANSRRPCGSCVAGREVLEDGYGGWIRPVSPRPSAEISPEERRYENGGEPQILDIVEIPMMAAVPRFHQTENHLIDAAYYWTKKGELTWADLADLVDRPESLWKNGDSTHHGLNDRTSQSFASHLTNSLFLIEPQGLSVKVQTEVGVFENPTRRVRAAFRYKGTHYNFLVTDPLAEQAFLARDDEVYELNGMYLCLSLSEVYESDGYCHKLVDAMIGEHRW